MRTNLRRLAVTLLAAVGVVATSAAGPALAGTQDGGSSGTYLALGDSVPFGYYESTDTAIYEKASNFVGYPEIVGQDRNLTVLNASCPGETTDSFIKVTAQSNGCENRFDPQTKTLVPGGYRSAYPLHPFDYSKLRISQLQYAVHTLRTHHDIRLVTLMLGANDGFLCQARTADHCASLAETTAVAAHVRLNLIRILHALRSQGGYTGRIVVVTYYALDYSDVAGVTGTEILNGGISAAALADHDQVASGFNAFLPVAFAQGGGNSRKAGLVYPSPDVHPTPEGQELLARAVESVSRY